MLPTLLMILLMLPLSSAQRYNVHYRNRENSNRLYELRYAGKIMIAQQLEDLICNNKSYHKMMSPKTEDTPVTVNVSLHIQSIGSIDESKNEYSLILVLWRWWVDPRLAFNRTVAENVDLPEECVDCLWRPGVVFDNEKSSSKHDVTKSNVMLRIYWNGTVQLSTRLSLTLSCNMDLTWFPLDSQTCYMTITSGSYPTTDVVLQWLEPHTFDDINIPNFIITNKEFKNCTKQYNTGRVNETISCLRAVFTFKRQGLYYFLEFITPSLLLVMAFALLFSPSDMTLTSLGITVTLLLTMAAQCMTTHATIPKVFSVIAIDMAMEVFLIAIVVLFGCCLVQTCCWYKKKASARLQHAFTILQETSTALQTAAMLQTGEIQTPAKAALQRAATIVQSIIRLQQLKKQVTMKKLTHQRRAILLTTAATVVDDASETPREADRPPAREINPQEPPAPAPHHEVEARQPSAKKSELQKVSEALRELAGEDESKRPVSCCVVKRKYGEPFQKAIRILEDEATTQQLEAATLMQQAATDLQPNDITPHRVAMLLHHASTTLQQTAITLHRAATGHLDPTIVDTLKYANTGLKEAMKTLQEQMQLEQTPS